MDRIRYAVAHELKTVPLKEWLEVEKWYHSCVTQRNKTTQFYLNSKLMRTEPLKLKFDEELIGTRLRLCLIDKGKVTGPVKYKLMFIN